MRRSRSRGRKNIAHEIKKEETLSIQIQNKELRHASSTEKKSKDLSKKGAHFNAGQPQRRKIGSPVYSENQKQSCSKTSSSSSPSFSSSSSFSTDTPRAKDEVSTSSVLAPAAVNDSANARPRSIGRDSSGSSRSRRISGGNPQPTTMNNPEELHRIAQERATKLRSLRKYETSPHEPRQRFERHSQYKANRRRERPVLAQREKFHNHSHPYHPSEVPKRSRFKRGRTQKHAKMHNQAEISANTPKSANEDKSVQSVQSGAKKRFCVKIANNKVWELPNPQA